MRWRNTILPCTNQLFSAYCFDPPDIQGETDFTDPPDVHIGTLAVSPELVFFERTGSGVTSLLPSLDFRCMENGGDDRDGLEILYTTYWYIDHQLEFVLNNAFISKLTEYDLTSNGFSLGIFIQCGVKMANSTRGIKSSLAISDDFFAGIKANDKVITMNRAETYTLAFTPTVPIGCYDTVGSNTDQGDCKQKVNMITLAEDQCVLDDTNTGGVNPVTYHNSKQSMCGFEIEGCYPDGLADVAVPCNKTLRTYTMNVTTQSFGNDFTPSYKLRLQTQNLGTHTIWKNYLVETVDINIQDNINVKDKICYSHVDPHMQTFGGKTYENNDGEGEFILYRNIRYHIEVHEKTTVCNYGYAFCTCAVAIKAGGDVFLINLCNDQKFIGMTSCTDNALVIQKYSELDYQVQTNIGTLIKIRIRPHEEWAGLFYDELMNIDIVMSPKDFDSTRGLCGLVGNNPSNDFHDRNGNPLTYHDRTRFIEEWRLNNWDPEYLTITCKSNVLTWEEENEGLFCYCNCYENNCKTNVRSEAICSPSQYLNCSVSHIATQTLCEQFEDRCKAENRRRRSAFAIDPEEEMQRKTNLSRQRKAKIIKRQINNEISISKENATKMCTERITGTSSVQNYSELMGGYNYLSFIEDCIFDVFETQTLLWISAHETALKDAVQTGFKINSNYTLTHEEKLIDFKGQYCLFNCSGNGYCTNGVCKCEAGYFGPYCGSDITKGPEIDDVEGGGFCDKRYGSECRCFEIQTRDLAENFFCKKFHKQILRNGNVRERGTDIVSGLFMNIFMGQCCFEYERRRRSDSTVNVINDEYDVSISNDGVNFGSVTTLYIYDSTCLNTTLNDNGTVLFQVKNGTCIIDGSCYEEDDVDFGEYCLKCRSATNQFNWTYSCIDSDNKVNEDSNINVTIISVTLSIVGCILIVVISCLILKKIEKPKRSVSTTSRFTDAMVRGSSDVYFFHVENNVYQDNSLKRFKNDFDNRYKQN